MFKKIKNKDTHWLKVKKWKEIFHVNGNKKRPGAALFKSHRIDLKSKTVTRGASLVAQRLRICLPMQGTRVRALVWEDPTCHGATRPVSHNY